jgi:NAD(P) transhydrogenase
VPTELSERYDLIVTGSGPAGRAAAIEAAGLGKRVALVERAGLGGVSTNAGTLPLHVVRSAVLELAGQTHVYGSAYRRRPEVTVDDLVWRVAEVIERARQSVADELRVHHVDVLDGAARFVDPLTVEVEGPGGRGAHRAARFVVAVGSRPHRPQAVDFDDRIVLDADGILGLRRIPATLAVVGGGPIGLAYASLVAALGARVTVVDARPRLLDAFDDDIVDSLTYHLRGLGIELRLGAEVETVDRVGTNRVLVGLAGGTKLPAQAALYAVGRRGATDDLGLPAAGIDVDERGRVSVDGRYRTSQPHVFAAGDVLGSHPGFTAAAAQQGRLAALAAFGCPEVPLAPAPQTVSTIPEVSSVGMTERQATADGIPHVVGAALYRDLVRADVAGERAGLLKLLVHAETRRVLGVHVFGTSAAELVHLGQAVISAGLGVELLSGTAFDVPTYSEAYGVAAVQAMARLDRARSDRARCAA